MDILVLAIAFLVILLGAELFTNGIEWFGRKLELAEGAVGSVLAAVGTALPETMIPIIAILFGGGGDASHAVGVGAILGAPFMLSTLAMFVTGVGVIGSVAGGRPGRGCPSTPSCSSTTSATSSSPTPSRSGPRSCRPSSTWARYVVAVVLHRDLRLVREGPLRGRGRGGAPRSSPPLRFRRLDRRAPARPGGPRAADRQRPGHRGPRVHRRRRVPVRRRRRPTSRRRSASASSCSRW